MSDLFRTELIALLPRLRRFALGLTADSAEADDLVQAGCERALLKRSQWQEGTRLDSWMYRLMQNLWIDQLRARRPMADLDDGELEQLPGADWQAGLEARMTLEQVLAAMQKLPPAMRAVLSLVCVEGFSYQDAAAALEVPIGTVMSRLARARVALHAILGGQADAAV